MAGKDHIYMRRKGQTLVPSSKYDAGQLERYREYENLRVDISERRSNPQLRMYWAVVQKAVEATGRWPDKQSLHNALLMHLGFVNVYAAIGGKVHVEAKSAAMDKMDGQEFRAYFDAAMETIASEIGVPIEELLAAGAEDLVEQP